MTVTDLSAVELAGLLARREVGPVEVMQATLARVGEANPAVNAVVSLRDEEALLAEARAAEAAGPSGPLWGLPMAVKDLVATKGIRTTWGSPVYSGTVPQADDLIAARMRAAGAIFIGKTNVPEFGLGSHSYNPVFGVTRNPYDLSRTAGGSSGGAAAALACRMVALADGSDMMGSLRNPAAWCNVYGMRPSHGLVPGDPVGEMMLHPLATLGPMARTPADLALLLGVIAGPDPLQPAGADFVLGGEGPAGKRIGWLGDWGGAWPMEPGLLERGEAAAAVFAELGAVVEPVAPPYPAERIWESWVALRAWAVAGKQGALLDDPSNHGRMKPALIWEIERGRGLSNAEILEASARRSEWYRAAARMLDRYDAVILPSTQMWPFPAEWDWPKEVAGVATDTYHRWMECVVPASLIGLPVVNLPAGFGPEGLPAGVQLMGPRGADGALLALAEAYHAAVDWPAARVPGAAHRGLG
ncbi:amidase [Vannielia litorea]|uniref:Amidase n=1 Tax=Vannielia litorea TaxID=1217970 RepID=A0A1N6EQV1_9RHOB|nr:amidase [Vannielia litorea]SIN85378.1 amidase [Vannielia litorea]